MNLESELKARDVAHKSFQIRLAARLYRRKDPTPQNRWEMSVQFARPAGEMMKSPRGPCNCNRSQTPQVPTGGAELSGVYRDLARLHRRRGRPNAAAVEASRLEL